MLDEKGRLTAAHANGGNGGSGNEANIDSPNGNGGKGGNVTGAGEANGGNGGGTTSSISRPEHMVMVVLAELQSSLELMAAMAVAVTYFVALWGAMEEPP